MFPPESAIPEPIFKIGDHVTWWRNKNWRRTPIACSVVEIRHSIRVLPLDVEKLPRGVGSKARWVSRRSLSHERDAFELGRSRGGVVRGQLNFESDPGAEAVVPLPPPLGAPTEAEPPPLTNQPPVSISVVVPKAILGSRAGFSHRDGNECTCGRLPHEHTEADYDEHGVCVAPIKWNDPTSVVERQEVHPRDEQ